MYLLGFILIAGLVVLGTAIPVLKVLLYWLSEERKRKERIIKIIQDNHEPICEMCEYLILETSSCSVHFMCEGRWCEEAEEMFFEEKTNLDLKELL